MKKSVLARLYHEEPLSLGVEKFFLSGEKFHYLKNVLRLKVNDYFRMFNQIDGEFLAQINCYNKHDMQAILRDKIRVSHSLPKIELGLCLIKSDRMLEAMDMATQLGITSITPLTSQYSQRYAINYERFRSRIITAVEQSERLEIPKLNPSQDVINFINSHSNSDTTLICANEAVSFKNNLLQVRQWKTTTAIVIGPEGGFHKSELEVIEKLSNQQELISISLGETILRTETAVAAVLAQINILRRSL